MRPNILRSQFNHTGTSARTNGSAGNEIPLNTEEIKDIFNMYHTEPIFKISEKAFLSKVLPEPFTFQIPKLGLVNNRDVDIVIKGRWMPWLRQEFGWEKVVGAVPYMLIPLEHNPDHLVPYIPDPTTGYIVVYTTERKGRHPPKVRYRWYWNDTAQVQEEKNMLWIITENAPDASGRIRSPLASLLPVYRSMLKLRKAQDIASTQAAKPVHIIESNPSMQTAVDDGLARHSANWDKAAGIGKARRERMQQAELRVRQKELHRNLQMTEQANRQKSTTQPTLWTDTPQDMLEEMDAGFSNRTVALGAHRKYVTAARPQLVADYNKAEAQFNVMAAAVMDFALELLTPTGAARSQNVKGAEQYENERIREQSSHYESILRPAIILAYRKQLQSIMDDANHWHLSRLGGNAANVDLLYPELDVIIDLSNTTVTTDEEMISYWMNGFISQRTAAEHILKSKNIPLEKMQLSQWPDNFPKERIVKTQGNGGEKKQRAQKKERPEEKAPTEEKSHKKQKIKKTTDDKEKPSAPKEKNEDADIK
jgi:hypothetical protein